MHLCQAGIDMIYIRDTLGHTDLATTEVYAKLNIELLRDALEDAYPELPSHGLPDWKEDNSLMAMLDSLQFTLQPSSEEIQRRLHTFKEVFH